MTKGGVRPSKEEGRTSKRDARSYTRNTKKTPVRVPSAYWVPGSSPFLVDGRTHWSVSPLRQKGSPSWEASFLQAESKTWAPTCHHGLHSSPCQCQLLEQLLSELEGGKQGCLLSNVLPRKTRKGGERTSSEYRIREVNNVIREI